LDADAPIIETIEIVIKDERPALAPDGVKKLAIYLENKNQISAGDSYNRIR
jgi:hypothetical protein